MCCGSTPSKKQVQQAQPLRVAKQVTAPIIQMAKVNPQAVPKIPKSIKDQLILNQQLARIPKKA